MNINLEYYKVFYYVCQEGSLTAAAQRLCISQPAVSQAVRQLEKEAGTKLFSRTSKGVPEATALERAVTYRDKKIKPLFIEMKNKIGAPMRPACRL